MVIEYHILKRNLAQRRLPIRYDPFLLISHMRDATGNRLMLVRDRLLVLRRGQLSIHSSIIRSSSPIGCGHRGQWQITTILLSRRCLPLLPTTSASHAASAATPNRGQDDEHYTDEHKINGYFRTGSEIPPSIWVVFIEVSAG
jgi:hypothetical protein